MPVMVLSEICTDDKDEKINIDCNDDKNTNTTNTQHNICNNTTSEIVNEGRYIYNI